MRSIEMREPIINQALMLLAAAGLALCVSSQATSQVARRAPVTTQTTVRAAKTPYTAEYKITHVQTLADGTTITRESISVKALDSQGRRLTAFTMTNADHPGTHVVVFDPVTRTQTIWQSPGQVATVFKMSVPWAEAHCSTSTITHDDILVVGGPKAKYTSEDLGTESIQNIEARGKRHITTIAAGAEGNDAPLVTTSERWTALTPGLDGLVVREITSDPRRGNSTRELTSLTQGEPDPATFQPPEGYRIVTKESSRCADAPPAEAGTETTTPK
jgi:hypothetical protein